MANRKTCCGPDGISVFILSGDRWNVLFAKQTCQQPVLPVVSYLTIPLAGSYLWGYVVDLLNQTPVLEWCKARVYVLRWNWTMWSKDGNYSMLHSEYKWERLYDDLHRKRIFTLTFNNSCLSAVNLKLDMAVNVICNYWPDETISDLIQGPILIGVGNLHNMTTYCRAKSCRQLLWASAVCCVNTYKQSPMYICSLLWFSKKSIPGKGSELSQNKSGCRFERSIALLWAHVEITNFREYGVLVCKEGGKIMGQLFTKILRNGLVCWLFVYVIQYESSWLWTDFLHNHRTEIAGILDPISIYCNVCNGHLHFKSGMAPSITVVPLLFLPVKFLLMLLLIHFNLNEIIEHFLAWTERWRDGCMWRP